jgi:hypothetical protein
MLFLLVKYITFAHKNLIDAKYDERGFYSLSLPFMILKENEALSMMRGCFILDMRPYYCFDIKLTFHSRHGMRYLMSPLPHPKS